MEKMTKKKEKEIGKYFLANGWKQTMSHYKSNPVALSKIVTADLRAKRKEIEKEEKRSARLAAKSEAGGKKAPRKAPKKAKTPKAPTASKKASSGAKPNDLDTDRLVAFLSAYRGQQVDTVLVDVLLSN